MYQKADTPLPPSQRICDLGLVEYKELRFYRISPKILFKWAVVSTSVIHCLLLADHIKLDNAKWSRREAAQRAERVEQMALTSLKVKKDTVTPYMFNDLEPANLLMLSPHQSLRSQS